MPHFGRIVTSTEEKITKEGAKKSRQVNKGDLILSNSMSYGLPYIMGIDGYIHDGWFVLKNFENTFDKDYLCNLLISRAIQNQYKRLAAGGVVQNISSDLVNSVSVSIPTMMEQKKISSLLNLIDERIATQNKIIEDLKKLKSAIYQNLFFHLQGDKVPLSELAEIIKGIGDKLLFNEAWTTTRLCDILTERIEKSKMNNQHEVLSSTVKGIYSQREYFSKDIASENNVGYKIIHLHDIVLSPQNLWMGNINYNNRFDIGIVSPSYKIYKVSPKFDKHFIASMLRTHRALYNYQLVSEQGASVVRRNLNMEAFEQLTFKIPSYDLQVKIGHTLSLLQNQLDTAFATKQAYHQQKQYLLSQMFI